MTRWLRGWRFVIVGTLVVAASACGGSGPTGDVGTFEVEMSQLSVAIKNTAGFALSDITIEIVPSGRPMRYTTWVDRMENSYRREFSLSSFKDREGAGFNLRLAKPRSVVITAKDMSGKTFRLETPWK